MRDFLGAAGGVLLGILAGLLLWAALLGFELQRNEAGLWSLRAQRILGCSLDYRSPGLIKGALGLSLTCDGD